MFKRISLNGDDWQFHSYMPNQWRFRREPAPFAPNYEVTYWLKGEVPGTVQSDLLANVRIPDPYFEMNSLLCEWVYNRDWIYRKKFTVPEELKGSRARLCFKGIDYSAYLYLNGMLLGYHDKGMFIPVVFEVTDKLKYGEENTLVAILEKAPDEYAQIGYTSKVKTRKSRVTYQWDFATRLVPLGLWEGVELLFDDGCYIDNIWVRSELSPDFKKAEILVETEIEAESGKQVDITADIYYGEEKVTSATSKHYLAQGMNTVHQTISLDDPKLWWPNGYGLQNLYRAVVSLGSEGEPLDTREVNFGIRKLEALPNDNAPEDAFPYVISINGRKIFVKGWNWVPVDHMYGKERPEKYERLLRLAKEANVNLLRIWGGGLIEKEIFYDLCDKYGIMIWQEFIQSSSGLDNYPPEDPQYLRLLKEEAESVIRRKRNHPALVIWCGGNELTELGESRRPIDGDEPAIIILHNAVKKFDPERIFLLTSPTGPYFFIAPWEEKNKLHDVHGNWVYMGPRKHYEFYNSSDALFHSEFGSEGASSLRTLKKFLSEDNLWPPDRRNEVWEHHGDWWMGNKETLDAIFGELEDIDNFIWASQFIQAEGVRYIIEQNRRRKYRCSGTIPWQMNEPWPNAICTNSVDFYTEPKMAYYYVAESYEPVHISLKYDGLEWKSGEDFKAEIYLSNSGEALTGAVNYIISDLKGKVYESDRIQVDIGSNCSMKVKDIVWSIPSDFENIFVISFAFVGEGKGVLSRNDYFFSTAQPIFKGFLELPRVELNIWEIKELEADREGERSYDITVENKGEVYACFVRCQVENEDDYYLYANDNFKLIPPKSKAIYSLTLSPRKEGVGKAEISFEGWNADKVVKEL